MYNIWTYFLLSSDPNIEESPLTSDLQSRRRNKNTPIFDLYLRRWKKPHIFHLRHEDKHFIVHSTPKMKDRYQTSLLSLPTPLPPSELSRS